MIAQGENSGIAFNGGNTDSEQLAKAIVALANLYGGRVLLGVEDDGRMSGLSRDDVQEWVFNGLRDKVTPQILPSYEEVKVSDRVHVAVITVGQGILKPYMLKHSGREDAYTRMGNRSESATREQQLRLFQAGGLLHVETLPVSSARLQDLDLERLRYHIQAHIGDQELPQTPSEWHERLTGLGMMVTDGLGAVVATVAGVLLFGSAPDASCPKPD